MGGMDVSGDKNEIYRLTPWGCLVVTLDDYGIDHSHITPKVGAHMAEDFMELMGKMGHVRWESGGKVTGKEEETYED